MREPSKAAIEAIQKIVSFPTISKTSNLELIEWMKGIYDKYDIPYRLSYAPEGDRANIFATIGKEDKPGLVLSGHVDVVPVAGQKWTNDPFTPWVADGNIYGRGTVDMKGFTAIVLANIEKFVAVRDQLQCPIHIATTYDEEVGCEGIKTLLDDIKNIPHKPWGAIVGEATKMGIWVGHKGKADFKCKVIGKEGHSSAPHLFVNALDYAAELVLFIRDLNARCHEQGPFDDNYSPNHATVHTGVFHSGTAVNIVPNVATFDFEIRYFKGQDYKPLFEEIKDFANKKLLPRMHKVDPKTSIEFEEVAHTGTMHTDENAEVVKFVQELTGETDFGYISGGTEGGDFSEAGIPAIVFGPGDTYQCHQPDEHIGLEQVAKCEEFLEKLIAKLGG